MNTATDPMAPKEVAAAEQIEEVRRQLRRFLANVAVPALREAEKSGVFPRELIAQVGAAGFYGAAFPERVGGSALGFRAAAAITEEIAKVAPQLSTTLNQQGMSCPYTMLRYGRPEIAEQIGRAHV